MGPMIITNILQYTGFYMKIVEAHIYLVKECEVTIVDYLIKELKVGP